MSSVAVIGGGWAGCAAAVVLARRGHAVVLYEAATALGGRARTVVRDGLPLDNGQHLLLGAYTSTLGLARFVHRDRAPWQRRLLSIAPLSNDQPHAVRIRSRALPAPLGLAAGLITARGFGLADRAGAMRAFSRWKRARFRCDPALTVEQLLRAVPPRVARGLWAPLCVAALNTPPARASAQVFLNVVAAAFDADADAADLVLPTGSIGAAFPDACARWLVAQGQAVRVGATAIVAASAPDGVRVAAEGRHDHVDAAVVAVGPHQLARTFGPDAAADPAIAAVLATVAAYRYESITTVYLGYRGTRIALPEGLVRLDDEPGQWLFERDDILRHGAGTAPPLDQLLAVVISTSGPHDDLAQPALAAACDRQLRARRPELPPLAWSRVIAERRATYACTPGLAHPRVRIAPRIYLAGDYVYPAFPATIEAAVRSGEDAGRAIDAAALGR